MRVIRTALIGVGAVNRSFLEILTRKATRLQAQYGLTFRIVLAADSSGVVRQPAGLEPSTLYAFKHNDGRLRDWGEAVAAARVTVLQETACDLVLEAVTSGDQFGSSTN